MTELAKKLYSIQRKQNELSVQNQWAKTDQLEKTYTLELFSLCKAQKISVSPCQKTADVKNHLLQFLEFRGPGTPSNQFSVILLEINAETQVKQLSATDLTEKQTNKDLKTAQRLRHY